MKRIHDYDEIFKIIVLYKQVNDGLSPTLRGLMRASGINSTSTIARILNCLEEEGKIRRTKRGIMVVGGSWYYGGKE